MPTSSAVSPLRRVSAASERGAGVSRRSREWFRALSLVPFALFLIAFAIFPLAQIIRLAFSDTRIVNGAFVSRLSGTGNFAQLAQDGTAHYSFLVTLLFIAVTVPATVILGSLIAILVDKSTRLAGLANSLLLWPALLAPVVVSVIWLLILSPNIGSLNRLLATLGLPPQGWLGTQTGAIASIMIVDIWHWTPLVFILVYSALKTLDRDILEAARIDGANEWNLHLHVVIPLLRPAILTAAGIRVTMGAKAFDEMYLLTQGGPGHATTLISLYIRDVFFDQLKLGYGAAISVITIVAVAVALALVWLGRFSVRLARS